MIPRTSFVKLLLTRHELDPQFPLLVLFPKHFFVENLFSLFNRRIICCTDLIFAPRNLLNLEVPDLCRHYYAPYMSLTAPPVLFLLLNLRTKYVKGVHILPHIHLSTVLHLVPQYSFVENCLTFQK
jgi:hypothetical protein